MTRATTIGISVMRRKVCIFGITTVAAALSIGAAGCGNKANDTGSAPSTAAPMSKNVPPAAAQEAQGAQQAAQQQGQDAAARAAAFKAARDKAGGR